LRHSGASRPGTHFEIKQQREIPPKKTGYRKGKPFGDPVMSECGFRRYIQELQSVIVTSRPFRKRYAALRNPRRPGQAVPFEMKTVSSVFHNKLPNISNPQTVYFFLSFTTTVSASSEKEVALPLFTAAVL
jgi:hypothetical protein